MDTLFFKSNTLRSKRTAIALIGSLGHTLVCFALWQAGFFRVTFQEFLILFSAIWGINLLFLIAISTGFSLKFKDPSMTFLQTLWSQACVMLTVYFSDRLEPVLLFFALLGILFGAFRLNTKQIIFLISFSISLYIFGIIAHFVLHPDVFLFASKLIIIFSFCFVALGFMFVTSDLSSMRSHLQKKKMELESSLIVVQADVITDELTNIRNRRYIMGILEQQLNASRREKDYCFSIAILDIDHFKDINDRHGHDMGDLVLKSISKLLQFQVRKIDYFARFGGEEFMLVAPFSHVKQIKRQVERLRQEVNNANFDHILQGIKISISVGVTEYRKPEPIEETLKRADKALYIAKEQGRDRVAEL